MGNKSKQTKAEKFRSKGSDILKNKPSGITDFLNDTPPHNENTQIHKPTITQNGDMATELFQNNIDDKSPGIKKEALGRLHLQIRQDLIEKLLDAVFKRKRTKKLKSRGASQRAVIEDALEYYFKRNAN